MDDDDRPKFTPPEGVRTFKELLEVYRVGGSRAGEIVTHTSLADPAGAFNVPGVAYDHFLSEYAAAVDAGQHLHLAERPCQHFPLLVDLDFRFPLPPAGDALERKYDDAFVDAAVVAYAGALRGLLATAVNKRADRSGDEVVETFVVHVMQRPGPYQSGDVVKDGLHLVFSNCRMTSTLQRMVRSRAMAALTVAIAAIPGQINPVASVVDDATTHNLWMLYGARKPGRSPYVQTRLVTVANDGVVRPVVQPATTYDLVHRLAVRKPRPPAALSPAAYKEVKDEADAERARERAEMLRREGFQTHRNTTSCSSLDADLARRLVPLLADSRADKYDTWVRVGWCLRNIDDSLLSEWDAWSKKSPKYAAGECSFLWPHYKNEHGLGLGTLSHWAAEDSPDAYAAVRAERNCGLVDKAVATMAHFDVAKVVFEEYKDQFVCVSAGGGGKWYRFQDHRWRPTNKAGEMRLALSMSVHDAFERRARVVRREAANSEEDAGKAAKRAAKYDDMCKNLKQTGFKDSVMREAADLFYRDKFEGRLDGDPDLIGFENGVYDLARAVFRDGRPEDMISMSTGHDYVEVDETAPEVAEIDAFFATVFPSPGLREYFLSRMAAYLSGRIIKEEFLILTGSGSNGKSKTIEFLQSALGEYAVNLPTALLTQKRGASNAASPEVARLKGRRLAVMQEPSDTDRLNISILKEATGSDVMQARPLYGEPFEFRPQFSMVLTCNTLPIVPDNDGGTWRRIKVVEFGSKFTSSPDPDDPSHFPIDLHLSDKFPRWRPAFVCMLLRRFAAERGRPMREPDEVNRACDEYRSEQDQYSQFALECFQRATGEDLSLGDVHSAFRAWAKQRMLSRHVQCMGSSQLAKKIQLLGKLRKVGGRTFWSGWTLKSDDGGEYGGEYGAKI